MSIQPFFKPENKNDETMNIYTKSITVDSFNADNLNLNNLEIDSLTSKEYKFKDDDNNTYDNLNISYNSNSFLFYSWIPQTAGQWWGFQVLSNSGRTILKVPNDNIRIGSTFHLSLGLEIQDSTQASQNVVDIGLKLGNGSIHSLGFSTEPPKHLTPIIVTIDCCIICTAKTTVAPLEYDFIIRANFIENNDNQVMHNNYNKSLLIQNVPYVVGNDNFMEFMYRINGSNGFTTYERGVYRLFQTI
jgi:hypothetical protein